MKKVYLLVLCLLLSANSAFATCVTTITASTPSSDFTVNVDGTITHNKTGLMWKQCSEGLSGTTCATGTATSLNWYGGLHAANASTFAGYNDWRLPNIKELSSIVEERCSLPAINTTIFPATKSMWYLSSSQGATRGRDVWRVKFDYGSDVQGGKNVTTYIRLVRGGL